MYIGVYANNIGGIVMVNVTMHIAYMDPMGINIYIYIISSPRVMVPAL